VGNIQKLEVITGSLEVDIPEFVWYPELRLVGLASDPDPGGVIRVLHVPTGWTDYTYASWVMDGLTWVFTSRDSRGFMGAAEPAGSVCWAFRPFILQRADGAKLLEVWPSNSVPTLTPYVDGDIDVSTCPGRIPSADPAWDGSLPYKPIGAGHTFWYLPGWSGAPARSVSGIGLNLAELNYNHDVANKWCFRLYLANTGWPFVGLAFEGQKDCEESNPGGVYIKTDGCALNATLTIVCADPP